MACADWPKSANQPIELISVDGVATPGSSESLRASGAVHRPAICILML